MNRLSLSRARDDAAPGLDIATPVELAPQEDRPRRAGDAIYEIGVMLAVHLAFAFAVLLTLRAFGVS